MLYIVYKMDKIELEKLIQEIKEEYANDKYYQQFIKDCFEIFGDYVDTDKYSLVDL